MKVRITVGIVLLAMLFAAGAGMAQKAEKIKEVVEERNEMLMTGMKTADPGMIASVYTADAWAMVPDYKLIKGGEAIAAEMGGEAMDIRLNTAEVEVAGDWAWETGTWTFHTPDGTRADHGYYMCVWQKTDDGWKIHRDIWNSMMSDMPAHEEMKTSEEKDDMMQSGDQDDMHDDGMSPASEDPHRGDK